MAVSSPKILGFCPCTKARKQRLREDEEIALGSQVGNGRERGSNSGLSDSKALHTSTSPCDHVSPTYIIMKYFLKA